MTGWKSLGPVNDNWLNFRVEIRTADAEQFEDIGQEVLNIQSDEETRDEL